MTPVSVVALSAIVAAPLMSVALPPIYEVAHGTHDPVEIRKWAVGAGVVVVTLGVLASVGSRTPVPLFGAVLGAAVVYAAYEYALRGR